VIKKTRHVRFDHLSFTSLQEFLTTSMMFYAFFSFFTFFSTCSKFLRTSRAVRAFSQVTGASVHVVKKKVKGASCPKKLMRVMQVMRSFILGCLVRKPQNPKQISNSAPQKRKRATVMYNTVGQRTQKRDGTQHAFLKNLVVWAAVLCTKST